MKVHNKLVRDLIPAIIRSAGRTPICETLSEEAYLAALETKLQEEVHEYLSTPCMEEIADILEVIEAICKARGYDKNELLAIKSKKTAARGAFNDRIFLKHVLDEND